MDADTKARFDVIRQTRRYGEELNRLKKLGYDSIQADSMALNTTANEMYDYSKKESTSQPQPQVKPKMFPPQPEPKKSELNFDSFGKRLREALSTEKK